MRVCKYSTKHKLRVASGKSNNICSATRGNSISQAVLDWSRNTSTSGRPLGRASARKVKYSYVCGFAHSKRADTGGNRTPTGDCCLHSAELLEFRAFSPHTPLLSKRTVCFTTFHTYPSGQPLSAVGGVASTPISEKI